MWQDNVARSCLRLRSLLPDAEWEMILVCIVWAWIMICTRQCFLGITGFLDFAHSRHLALPRWPGRLVLCRGTCGRTVRPSGGERTGHVVMKIHCTVLLHVKHPSGREKSEVLQLQAQRLDLAPWLARM